MHLTLLPLGSSPPRARHTVRKSGFSFIVIPVRKDHGTAVRAIVLTGAVLFAEHTSHTLSPAAIAARSLFWHVIYLIYVISLVVITAGAVIGEAHR
jgi:hypothetical protein